LILFLNLPEMRLLSIVGEGPGFKAEAAQESGRQCRERS
jgi:hypothetical protein